MQLIGMRISQTLIADNIRTVLTEVSDRLVMYYTVIHILLYMYVYLIVSIFYHFYKDIM